MAHGRRRNADGGDALAGDGNALNGLRFELLIFAAQRVNLPEQFAARQNGISKVGGQLLRGAGEAEQRQKPAFDGEFEARGGA